MPHRYLLATLAVLLLGPAAGAVDPADLKPGLVATYRGASGESVTRLEPTVALTLGKAETPHPKLAILASATRSGYVNITRPGKYTFSANLSGGSLRVRVGGKVVLDGATANLNGNSVQLDGGVQPFEATLTAHGGACRVELFWEGPGFEREPLPHQFLGHLPKERPAEFARDLELEHGRFKFEELACIKCHRPTAEDRMAKTLVDRTGPNLTEIAKRAYPGWIDAWLADPAKLRPQTTMPKLFTDDDHGKAERYAITQYLVALGGGALAPYRMPFNPPDNVRQSFDRGRVLYTVAGCAACHQEAKPKPKNEEDDREPLK